MTNEEIVKKVAELEEKNTELEKNRVSDRQLIEGLSERVDNSDKLIGLLNISQLHKLQLDIQNLKLELSIISKDVADNPRNHSK